jgi:pimeloyl-ACP methyl ester carboxylesterase
VKPFLKYLLAENILAVAMTWKLILLKSASFITQFAGHRLPSKLSGGAALRLRTSLAYALIGILPACWISASAKDVSVALKQSEFAARYAQIYEPELGPLRSCEEQVPEQVKVCSDALRNMGNAPYALFARAPKATVVLFHGLSDSPYFVESIARHLHREGYNVIAPLTPGHGKLEADADMQDPDLQQRWYSHLNQVMALAKLTHEKVFVGGFSTGGAFATYYTLKHPDEIEALLLFSGALQLSSSAETLSKVWGIKKLAVWLDGEYKTDGPNPYKYPKVATYSALVLMDVIKDIRGLLEAQEESENISRLSKPIFAAHSLADTTTMYEGIENLLSKVDGEHTRFKIDKDFDVCHADVVISSGQIINMNFDKSQVNPSERCAVPKANPLHSIMLSVLTSFVNQHSKEDVSLLAKPEP